MDQTLTTKIKKLGALLAESPLADEVKKVLLENAEQLTPESIDELLSSLEREQVEIESLEEDLATHDRDRKQEENIDTLEGQKIARKAIDDMLLEIVREDLIKKQ